MGFIAALQSKTGADVSAQILRMLRAASPGRRDGCGFSTPDGVRIFPTLPESLAFGSEGMLGHRLVKVMPNDPPQPVSQHGYTVIFEGRLWGRPAPSDLQAAADVIGSDPARGIRRLIEEERGSYVVSAAERGRLICGRDPVGVVPLYLGQTETLAGAASNRKMLWSIGLEADPLPPGSVAEIGRNGIRIHPVRGLRQPPTRAVSMEEAVETLDGLLLGAVEARSRGIFSASLGFSGGIDSALLAHYLDRCGVQVDLVCVGVEGSSDFEAAEAAADGLGFPLRLEAFPPAEVEADLDWVLGSVEEPDPMKVGVAIPLRWAVRSAARYGSGVFYSGNGSDELFGGYLKYVREYAASGDAVMDVMFRDVAAAHRFGLALPVELKLSADEGSPRKLLLRALARKIGLPDAVASRRKRAVQYSTGVSRTLKRLAKRAETTLSQYLAERFEGIKGRFLDAGDDR